MNRPMRKSTGSSLEVQCYFEFREYLTEFPDHMPLTCPNCRYIVDPNPITRFKSASLNPSYIEKDSMKQSFVIITAVLLVAAAAILAGCTSQTTPDSVVTTQSPTAIPTQIAQPPQPPNQPNPASQLKPLIRKIRMTCSSRQY